MGVGNALRDGYAASTERYVLKMDSDFVQIAPELRETGLKPLMAGYDIQESLHSNPQSESQSFRLECSGRTNYE
jgi:hypothetical protein